MILLVVLGLLLSVSYPAVDAFYSVWRADSAVSTVAAKRRDAVFLDSALRKAVEVLKRDDGAYDALSEFWAKPIVLETPVGELSVQIVDLDRYLNLNLVGRNPLVTAAFERLLLLLEVDYELLDRLLMWSGVRKPSGQPRTAFPVKGRPLDSVYELLYFWNETADLYGGNKGGITYPGLLELTTVHSDGKINLNTAPYWILRSLDDELDDALARQIIEERERSPFKSLQEVLRVPGVSADLLYRISKLVKFRSRYFKITLKLKRGEFQTVLEAVYDRATDKVLEKAIY
ncbi:MAG: general secretion pathway protein GspK [Aquificae bacterium]|nr:general secretion pathway protein GspK [Aquificota bacterium]